MVQKHSIFEGRFVFMQFIFFTIHTTKTIIAIGSATKGKMTKLSNGDQKFGWNGKRTLAYPRCPKVLFAVSIPDYETSCL